MRILITGRGGQVGWECQRSLQALGDVISIGRAEADFSNPRAIRDLVAAAAPDLIVNAAAYTAVDRAESEPELAYAVNATAPAVLAESARQGGVALIHLSTDYVFDGTRDGPYAEGDACNPLSVYGRTKLQGEQAVVASGAPAMILRTSWVYAMRGSNFLRTIVRLSREREELRIVDDQWGAPTWARSIAEAIAVIAARAGTDRHSIAAAFSARGGIYHMTAAGSTNWHQFATALLERIADPGRRLSRIVPIPTRDYPTPARRPVNSRLDCGRLARDWGVALPRWDLALDLAAAEGLAQS
jgi:dTDP-4-dehydrorhamnose reductase